MKLLKLLYKLITGCESRFVSVNTGHSIIYNSVVYSLENNTIVSYELSEPDLKAGRHREINFTKYASFEDEILLQLVDIKKLGWLNYKCTWGIPQTSDTDHHLKKIDLILTKLFKPYLK